MSDATDGDLIRPLGLVTLYFGYLEAEVNALVSRLRDAGVPIEVSESSSLGLRLIEVGEAVQGLADPAADEVLALIGQSKILIDQRNALVHASVLARGRVLPNKANSPEFQVNPTELTALANQAFDWKEQLSAAVQLRLLPALRQKGSNGT